jgi:LysR family nitrogen assimilation transcriptional regulator
MKYFIAIAEKRSLAAAATHIGIAQPSLSQHIKLLEQRLGVELLVRSPRGVELTEAGQVMLLHARRITAATDLALEEVRLAGTEAVGRVVFGFPSSVSMVLSVPLAETIRLEHPKIRFRAVEAMSGFIKDWLADGSVDLAILYDTSTLKNVDSQLLLAEDMHFYCANDAWPFLSPPGEPIPLESVAAQELVLPSSNHGLRILIDRYCKVHGITPDVVVEMDSLSQILALVARGSASTILAPAAAHGHIDAGRLLSAPICDPTIRRPVYLVRNPECMVTRASREVEALTVKVVRELVQRDIWRGQLVS